MRIGKRSTSTDRTRPGSSAYRWASLAILVAVQPLGQTSSALAGSNSLNGGSVRVENQCLGSITVGKIATTTLDQAYAYGAPCGQLKLEARVKTRSGGFTTTRRITSAQFATRATFGVQGSIKAGPGTLRSARACFRLVANEGSYTCTAWYGNPNF